VAMAANLTAGADVNSPPAPSAKSRIIAEGVVLQGVSGKIVEGPAGAASYFSPQSEVKAAGGFYPADSNLPLLPCSTLESIQADIAKRESPRYRLWCRVTQFNGENYFYPVYFFPLSRMKQQEQKNDVAQERDITEGSDMAVNDSNDAFALPEEVSKQLASKRPTPIRQGLSDIKVKLDTVLIGRLGKIKSDSNGGYVFMPCGLGRNIEHESFGLLPCLALQETLRNYGNLENVRFEVSGLVTEYRDRKYLLLQWASERCDYDNFSD